MHRVVVGAEPGLVRLGIGKFPDFENSPDPAPSDLVSLKLPLIGPVAKVTGSADIPYQSAGVDLRFDGPFVPAIDEPSEDNTQTVGTPLGDDCRPRCRPCSRTHSSRSSRRAAWGRSRSARRTARSPEVTNLLQPVLTLIDAPLIELFEALGLTLGGADITILSLEADQPALAR